MTDIQSLIIYEDKDFYVCRKPAGMLAQADRGFQEDMVSSLLTLERKKGIKAPFIAPVNRLDRPVEGLILFARNSKAAGQLTGQVSSRQVDKHYYGVVDNNSLSDAKVKEMIDAKEKITLKDYLRKNAKDNVSEVVSEKVKDAKEAVLEYEILEACGKNLLLEIKLHTGRHHQIRVQLAHAGLPLVGDTKYNEAYARKKGWHNIGLCSYLLEFTQPATGKKLHLTTKPDSEPFHQFSYFSENE